MNESNGSDIAMVGGEWMGRWVVIFDCAAVGQPANSSCTVSAAIETQCSGMLFL